MKQYVAILTDEDWNLHQVNPETRLPEDEPIIKDCVSISELIDEAKMEYDIPAEAIIGKIIHE